LRISKWQADERRETTMLGFSEVRAVESNVADNFHSGREHLLPRDLIGLATPGELRVSEAVEDPQLGRLGEAGAFHHL
jgi:hypothetical protein